MMIKRLFLVSLALLLGVSSTLLLPNNANASSDYGIQVTNKLTIGGVDSSTIDTCVEQDISTTYLSRFKDTEEYKNNQYGVATSQIDAFLSRLQSNITAGAGWAVVQSPNDQVGAPVVRMYLFDPARSATISNGYITFSGGGGLDVMDIYRDPSNCDHYRSVSIGGHTGANGVNLSSGEKLFILSATPVITPEDYNGPVIPTSYVAPDTKIKYSVDFTVDGSKTNFTALYSRYKTDPVSNLSSPTKIRWYLAQTATDPIPITPDIPPTYSYICSAELDTKTPFTAQNCKQHAFTYHDDGTNPSVGATPDLKQEQYSIIAVPYPPDPLPSGYVLDVQSAIHKVDFSKDAYNLDTQKCSVPGAIDTHTTSVTPASDCNESTIYEQCDVGDMACYIRNFQLWFVKTLQYLFVPRDNPFNTINSVFHDKLGFLTYPVDFIVQFFNSLAFDSNQWTTSAQCDRNYGDFFGKQVHFNFCTMRDDFPSLWNNVILIIRASTITILIFALFRKFKAIASDGSSVNGSAS